MVPGFIVFSILGASGQAAANWRSSSTSPDSSKKSSSYIPSDWRPFKKLTDKEYAEMLEEKLLRVEAEIAILDDNINELRAAKQTTDSREQESSSRSRQDKER